MKTKIIPFDLETAKKIQAGEIEGKIKTRNDRDVDILCFNRKSVSDAPIVALIHFHINEDLVHTYTKTGYIDSALGDKGLDLLLEVPDNDVVEETHTGNICFLKHSEPQKHQFKPFDRVLVRSEEGRWTCALFSHMTNKDGFPYSANNFLWKYCIPYEGNEHLVGTTNKPKEE